MLWSVFLAEAARSAICVVATGGQSPRINQARIWTWLSASIPACLCARARKACINSTWRKAASAGGSDDRGNSYSRESHLSYRMVK